MSLFISLIVIQLVIFGILVVFLRVILTRNITKATSHISELNQDYTQKLEDAQKRLQEADKYYDDILLKAKTEAEKTKMQLLKDASDSQQLIINQSRKQSEEIIEKAQKSTEALLSEVNLKISEGATQKACELIQKILPDLITKEMHEAWVEALSKHGLEELDRLNVTREVQEAMITSAYALTPSQRASLEKKITSKLGREIRFKNEIDPGLIAGIKISVGSVLIDGSLKFKIKEIARHG
jgi:F0F1-type ATP synthase delta subunit